MQNSLNIIILVLIAISSLINWVAAWQWRPKVYYASKPFAMIFLIVFFLLQGPMTRQKIPFLIGLIFSLLGDVILIKRSIRWFIAGLCAFRSPNFLHHRIQHVIDKCAGAGSFYLRAIAWGDNHASGN